MKEEITPPFRLYDFLAYLFPGAATFHALYCLESVKPTSLAQGLSTKDPVLDVLLLLVGAYIVGLAWSVISREVLRPLIWIRWHPRIQYFENSAENSPLGHSLARQLQILTRQVFNDSSLSGPQAHRLCRAYVAQHCPKAWANREAIVAVRSMCANLICPIIVYALAFATKGWWAMVIASVTVFVSLIIKMISLDQREWREIYFAFLAHQSTRNYSVASEENGGAH
jgi:hypothetical protein